MRRSLSALSLILLLLVTACTERVEHFNRGVTFDDIKPWIRSEFSLYSNRIRQEIGRQIEADPMPMYADQYTRNYYLNSGKFVWITRHGVDDRADTLLHYLQGTAQLGFQDKTFHVTKIQQDLEALRNRDFDAERNQVNTLMGRLEYNLTQALLRYSCGQRFGYTRPLRFMNQLLEDDSIGGHPTYRRIFDMPVEVPTDSFVTATLQQVKEHKLSEFLRQIQPTDSLYCQLLHDYQKAVSQNNPARARLAKINLERSRWRYPHPIGEKKYVWVNLADFRLTAVDRERDTVLTMRICGGDQKHKTPLLTSHITHTELNPFWTIPQTIVRKEICAHHLHDSAYFARNNIRAINKETGEIINPTPLSESELRSGRYTLRQDNGEGNSLGRMIFRFPNEFSVYLHDTNNRGAFQRTVRAVSHGCIRLERPMELALFLLGDPEEEYVDQIRVSIDLAPLTPRWQRWVEENPEHKAPLSSFKYSPAIPIWLDYYTLFPSPDGILQEHPDNYGYDKVIEELLRPL